ncbi:MAG: hypothetical protein M3N10_01020 [Actinomycetota bacterium]|nr:hypothetical protein [Actinomycetota bacterium]
MQHSVARASVVEIVTISTMMLPPTMELNVGVNIFFVVENLNHKGS